MRVARPLVPVLIALLALAGSALGVERSGGLFDAAGDVTSADGFARPDVAEFRVAHDPDAGTLVTTVRFHGAVPQQTAGRPTEFMVVYNTGRAAPEGYCDWTHSGDLGVRIDVVRSPQNDFIVQTATPRGRPDIIDNAAGSFSADARTLTLRTSSPEFLGKNYTCVSPTRVTYGSLTGADEVAEFFFAGFAPPPPPPDNQLPSIRWENPRGGTTISGVYSEGGQNGSTVCRMTASDNVRVNRIEIFVDDVPIEVQRFAPWGCEIDTRKLSEGPHVLRADAYDEAGNKASTAISVTVRNSGVAPPPAPPPVVIPPDAVPLPVTTPVVETPPVVVTDLPDRNVTLPTKVTPNVISRLEPFMRCRVVGRTVRGCRFKPSAFLSVRVTDQNGALRMDRSGAVRLAVSCRPKARCDRRVLRLRTARMTLASLLGGPAIRVGTTVEIRLTRRGSVGRHHRLTVTRNGPRSRTCELVGSRLRSCE